MILREVKSDVVNSITMPRVATGLAVVALGAGVSGCGSDVAEFAVVPHGSTEAGLRWGANGVPGLSFYVDKDRARTVDCGARYVPGDFIGDTLNGRDIVKNKKSIFKYNDHQSLVVCGGLALNGYQTPRPTS